MGVIETMDVLVVGGDGREHALAWALRQSDRVRQIFVAPGNAGTAGIATNVPISDNDIPALVAFSQEQQIGLTVVGPEVPLAAGIVDAFQAAGLAIFGPTQAAAQLESSKAFAKEFMERHNIPTAAYAAFEDYEAAVEYVQQASRPLVVKADGLAAGKGVLMCQTAGEAISALSQIMNDGIFGAAGSQVVIEEWLQGPELSVLAFSDGQTLAVMPPARDHKRAYDHDQGPNTGGMGAYAPAPDITPAFIEEIRQTILQPAIDGMAAEGSPYVGILYAGLMLTADGPRALEFNCRFGDPETQVILPLLESDLVDIFTACIDGRLSALDLRWKAGACATVVLASPGYPNSYPKNLPISGLAATSNEADVIVFHAGTGEQHGQVVTTGGRVLAVSGIGADLPAALRRSYAAIEQIQFEGMYYRRDIGQSQA